MGKYSRSNMFLILSAIILNFFITTATSLETPAEPKLELLNVVFRHGDRTPNGDSFELYPNDPYVNFSFPMGYGQLTNIGKMRAYSLGLHLRNMYNDFLGDYYLPDEVYARSTELDRTKMTLQVVLSSLYPPKDYQQWNPDVKWQPVSTLYYAPDGVLRPETTPEVIDAVEEVEKRPEMIKRIDAYQGLLRNLTEWTGTPMTTLKNIFDLHNTLLSESSMGLEIPSWANGLFPTGPILDGSILYYLMGHYTPRLKELRGGVFMEEVTNNMLKKINDTAEKKKIYLYSAHETNIVATLISLGLFEPPHVPQYSSAVTIELLGFGDKHYVRIRYYRGVSGDSSVKIIPGCEELCPFDKFVVLMKNIINNDTTSSTF